MADRDLRTFLLRLCHVALADNKTGGGISAVINQASCCQSPAEGTAGRGERKMPDVSHRHVHQVLVSGDEKGPFTPPLALYTLVFRQRRL